MLTSQSKIHCVEGIVVLVPFAALLAAAGASAAMVLSMQLQTAGASRKRPFVRHEEYYE